MARFRVTAVTIEGFRGFTAEQRVPLDGKHLFLFGPNGRGKSSIVEAIRWCLFGSPQGKQEIEVRNTFYAHTCRVVLELGGPDGPLYVNRELRPGAPQSRSAITDAAGNDLLQREAFPLLARLGPEGAQVIFAAQQASGRRPVDISDFNKALYFYLRLEDVPELLDRLKKLLEEREAESAGIAKDLDEFSAKWRRELELADARLTGLLRNPPWGDGPLPTHLDTQAKVDAFLREMSLLAGETPPTGVPPEEKLRLAQQLAAEAASKTVRETQEKLRQQQELLGQAEQALRQIGEAEASRRQSEEEAARARAALLAVLQGEGPAEMARKLEALEGSLSLCQARMDLATRAKSLCEKYVVKQCPVCGASYKGGSLITRVQEQISRCEPTSGNYLRDVESLRARLSEVEQLEKSLQVAEDGIKSSLETGSAAMRRLLALLGAADSPAPVESLELRVQEVRNAVRALEGQLGDAELERRRREKAGRDLSEELQFHREREHIQRIKNLLASGTLTARGFFEEHVALRKTVIETVEVLERSFASAIEKAIPELNRMLTEVYGRLTGQVSYDGVCIYMNPTSPASLELRVTSVRRPGHNFSPTVLNGQAAKALQLVPYFVFSKFHREVMEIDLLLIDDPSESFDAPHVDTLLQELAEAASHAQIVVATHERDRFEPRLGSYFAPGSYGTIVVEKFEPETGPRLDHG